MDKTKSFDTVWKEMYQYTPSPGIVVEAYCGQCKFFDSKCTTSAVEARYGNKNTPACTEFKGK